MVHSLEVASEMSDWLSTAYSDDTTMSDLKQVCQEGWDRTLRSHAPANLQPYWLVRDELYEVGSFLFVGERLVPVGA